jgi:flagella basal body P-ring formation protein FlgA
MGLLLPLLFIFSVVGLACEIKLPHQIIMLGGDGGADVIQLQDCPEQIRGDLLELLAGIEGKVSSHRLGQLLEQKSHFAISIQPASLQVTHLKHLIREQLELPAGVQVNSTHSTSNRAVVAVAEGTKISVQCPDCLYDGDQPLQLMIISGNGESQSIPAAANFRKMVRAYRLRTSVTAFAELNPLQQLSEEYVEAIPHTDLVTDGDSLKYYKTNKPLRAGALLKRSDLNGINLVRAGFKTEVVLENSAIMLKTHGISRSNGALGDAVEVFHPQKNKKYLGRVIDLNKVLVDL